MVVRLRVPKVEVGTEIRAHPPGDGTPSPRRARGVASRRARATGHAHGHRSPGGPREIDATPTDRAPSSCAVPSTTPLAPPIIGSTIARTVDRAPRGTARQGRGPRPRAASPRGRPRPDPRVADSRRLAFLQAFPDEALTAVRRSSCSTSTGVSRGCSSRSPRTSGNRLVARRPPPRVHRVGRRPLRRKEVPGRSRPRASSGGSTGAGTRSATSTAGATCGPLRCGMARGRTGSRAATGRRGIRRGLPTVDRSRSRRTGGRTPTSTRERRSGAFPRREASPSSSSRSRAAHRLRGPRTAAVACIGVDVADASTMLGRPVRRTADGSDQPVARADPRPPVGAWTTPTSTAGERSRTGPAWLGRTVYARPSGTPPWIFRWTPDQVANGQAPVAQADAACWAVAAADRTVVALRTLGTAPRRC
jgi:hypothetical protein